MSLSSRSPRAVLLAILLSAALAGPAAAQAAAIAVDSAAEDLPPAAIEAEVRRALDETGADAAGALTVRITADRHAELTWLPAESGVTRRIALPEAPAAALEAIALVAVNLMVDEAGGLLAPPDPRVSSPVPPPAAVTASTGAPPPALHIVPFGLSLVPGVSTDSLQVGPVAHRLSLGVLATSAAGVEGVALTGLVDVRSRTARGAQVAGVVAIAGPLKGVQMAGVVGLTSDATGAQVAGAIATARDRTGVGMASLAVIGRDVTGAQIAGAVDVARDVTGVQMAGALNVAREVRGLQLAPINVASRGRGLQLGVVNVAGDAEGIPLGVLSVVRGGPVRLDVAGETSGLTSVALRHGARRFHNIYAVGTTPLADDQTPMAGLGFGGHAELAVGALDVEAMSWIVPAGARFWRDTPGHLGQLRATLAIPVGPFAVIGGVAANYFNSSDPDDVERFSPVLESRFDDDEIHLWPSAIVGIRLERPPG